MSTDEKASQAGAEARASTGLGQCPDSRRVGGPYPVDLTCDLEQNHPDLHWDWSHDLIWQHWTEDQERADNPLGDYHSRTGLI